MTLAPCKTKGGAPAYPNQCAIRMGVCLQDAGVNLNFMRGVRCWHGHGRKHVLRAEELANWLKTQTAQFGTVEIKKRVTYKDYAGKKGIVLFRNFWGSGNQGDHIDLWNGSKMTYGELDYFQKSEEIWFWELQ